MTSARLEQARGTDARVSEMLELVRFERRRAATFLLYFVAVLVLFGLIGFNPGPLHRYAEALCERMLGAVDTRWLGYCSLALVLLAQVPLLLVLKKLIPATDAGRYERLEELRKELRAQGLTQHEMGEWTRKDWSRGLKRAALGCAVLTGVACAVLAAMGAGSRVDTVPAREVSLDGNGGVLQGGGTVRLTATARLDLAFRGSEVTYGAGILSGTRTTVFRLDRYGFQPTTRVDAVHTLYVPLTDAGWRPGDPIEAILQCDTACGFEVPEGSALSPKQIVVTGRLRREGMPLFVRRNFERAGLALASPYYVVADVEPNPADRVWLTGLVGLLTAGFLFLWATLIGAAAKKAAAPTTVAAADVPAAGVRADVPVAARVEDAVLAAREQEAAQPEEVPMVISVNRDSVCMADDIDSHEVTMSVAPTSRVLEVLEEALRVCPLAGVSGGATWSVSTVNARRRWMRSVAVLGQEGSRMELVVPEEETAATLFTDGAVGLRFGYCLQEDFEVIYQRVKAAAATPRFVATETIKLEGKEIPVREVELLQEAQARVLEAADETRYLEYQVSVGPYKVEIPVVHELTRPELVASWNKTLSLAELAVKLSERDQESGRFERHRVMFRNLIRLVEEEIAALQKIGLDTGGYVEKLTAMLAPMRAAVEVKGAAAFVQAARPYAIKLGSIYRLVDAQYTRSPLYAEQEAAEKGIYDTASQFYDETKPAAGS